MSWKRFLDRPSLEWFPWIGGRVLRRGHMSWKIEGALPSEHGWSQFRLERVSATYVTQVETTDMLVEDVWMPILASNHQKGGLRSFDRGYLVGNRLVSTMTHQTMNPYRFQRIATEAERVYLIEPGLDRFEHVEVARAYPDGPMIYFQRAMPLGPEAEVNRVFLEGGDDAALNGIKGLVPGLALAFRMEVHQREEAARRRVELERRRAEEEAKKAAMALREQLIRTLGNAETRRELARHDFRAAAIAALRVGGAEYIEHRHSVNRQEMVVRYRVDGERLECVCSATTLDIIDAGICLTSHGDDGFREGTKGDRMLTLESLPSVVREAIQERKLVVYRRVG